MINSRLGAYKYPAIIVSIIFVATKCFLLSELLSWGVTQNHFRSSLKDKAPRVPSG